MIPIISVIIPAYNAEKYIGRAIRSISNQLMSRTQYEVIVIDDASEDRTSYALELFSKDVTIIKNEKRLGLPACLNAGIKKARGKFVIRLDADDYVSEDYLYIMYRFLENNTNMDAIACDYLLVDSEEATIKRCNCLEEPIGCGIMFRVAQLIDVGLYDPEFKLHEDRDLRMRFEAKYKIYRLELPLYRYRKHEGNITNDTKLMASFERKLSDKHRAGDK